HQHQTCTEDGSGGSLRPDTMRFKCEKKSQNRENRCNPSDNRIASSVWKRIFPKPRQLDGLAAYLANLQLSEFPEAPATVTGLLPVRRETVRSIVRGEPPKERRDEHLSRSDARTR